jgi:exodeoxyribonuclease VII small subunit
MAENKDITFEQAAKELEDIVRKLESGQIDLENAIKDYERGNELRKICEQKLGEAKLKVEKIIKTQDGKITTEETQYA